MRRTSRALGTELWREIVERLNEGVIVFSDRGVVIYANDEAANLLAYTPRDVLELDRQDFVSLLQLDRLDSAHFASDFLGEHLADSPKREYEVATVARRLKIVPYVLDLENGRVTALLLEEVTDWRAHLITEAVMSPEMQGPLAFASSSCQTLVARLESGKAHPFELVDLARIVTNGVGRALALWEDLTQLYGTMPTAKGGWEIQAVSLPEAIQDALDNLAQHTVYGPPDIHLDLPSDLPPVAAARPHLHAALCSLFEGASERLPQRAGFSLSARHRRRYVQVDLTPQTPGGTLHGYLFDVMPLAITEQVILRHGGRLWIRSREGDRSVVSFSLPVWNGDSTTASST